MFNFLLSLLLFRTDLPLYYTTETTNIFYSNTWTSGITETIEIGTEVYILNYVEDNDRNMYETTIGFIEADKLTQDISAVFYPLDETKYAAEGTINYSNYTLETPLEEIELNTELHLIGKNNSDVYKLEDGSYVAAEDLMDEYYIAPQINANLATTSENSSQEIFYTNSNSGGGSVLTPSAGRITNAWGYEETYYNLDMNVVVSVAHNSGISGEYWVRSDGAKMLGNYIMVAANYSLHPYGSIVNTSLGQGIVVDTGGFAATNPYQYDLAVAWR